MSTTQIESDALLEAMQEFTDVQELDVGGPDAPVKLLSVPKGRMIVSVKKYLDEYLPRPERTVGTARLTTLDSFIDHVNRNKDEGSAIFVNDGNQPSLTAVYDYHESREKDPKASTARFGQHRAVYSFPVSPEWQAWVDHNGKAMDQLTFAHFLEERFADVLAPSEAGPGVKKFATDMGMTLASPAALMSLSKGLAINVDTKITNLHNLSSGEATLQFEEVHKDNSGAPLKVPGGFAIAVPLFRGGDAYQVPVRLRYRHAGGGKLVWTMALYNIHESLNDAMAVATDKVMKETGVPLFNGAPEA